MSNFCIQCGNKLEPKALFCPNCGTKIEAKPVQSQTARANRPTQTTREPSSPVPPSHKKVGKTALLLCIFLGMFGAHRFYVGKYLTGIVMLCTGGLLGVWVVIDLTSIARNKFEDKDGNELEVIHNITPVRETLLITASVMLWVALFFSAIALFLNYSSSSLVTVADAQLSALRNGKMEQAYAYTTESYQKNNSIDVFKNFVYSYPVLLNSIRSSFPERQIMGNNGYIRGFLTGKDGVQTPIAYQFIKENGQWKIVNIHIAIAQPNSTAPPQQPH